MPLLTDEDLVRLRAVAQRSTVALVIPAFNEEGYLPILLNEVAQQKSQWIAAGMDVELWVVNDGSSDQTRKVLTHAQKHQGSAVHWLEHALNLGIGKTIQTGMRAALESGADIIVQLDGDGQHPPSEIRKLIGPILSGQSDWVIGSRYLPKFRTNVSSLLREWGTRLFSLWVALLTGVRIFDTTSGFRAWSRRAALELVSQYPDDYPEVQSLVIASRLGHRVVEVPVQMRERRHGHSSITPMRSAYYFVKVLLATGVEALKKREGRR